MRADVAPELDYRLIHLPQIGSTNDEAARLARLGAACGLVVWADEQKSGRGRLGRAWASPPGNLYLSVLLPLDRTVAELGQLSFVAALALWDSLQALAPEPLALMLKWPNDVLLAGGKLAGLLLETWAPQGEAVEAVILGIGVNVRHSPQHSPYPVTSLAAHGVTLQPSALIAPLLSALDHWRQRWRRDGFAPVRASWLEKAHPPGFGLRVKTASSEWPGRFCGLAEDGALLVDVQGRTERLVAGDVFLAGDQNASGD